MIRRYCLDGDVCEVTFHYDTFCQKRFGEYPDFEEEPRYTPGGRPWVTVMQEGCPYGKNKYHPSEPCLDCGSCQYFLQERERDLIGICVNEKNQRKPSNAVNHIGERPISFIERSKGEDKT